MSEQDETAPVTDEAPVAETAAPGETEAPASPPEGYIEQSRYENLRAEHNRKQALWDRAQQGDLDAMRELELPVQFEDDEPEETDEEQDPYSTLEQRLSAQEERERQRVEQEGIGRFNADLDRLAGEKKVTLSKRERNAIYLETMQAGGTPQALEQVVTDLVKERADYDKAVVDRFVASKKNAPFISPGGTGATEVIDPLDGNARRERLAQQVTAAEALD